MKRIFEWIGGFALIAFSFYFTDQVSLMVASKSDLMNEIHKVSNEYELKPIDAKIDLNNNTIIPGKYGRKVNDRESYLSMKDFGAFNENYLIFDFLKPKNTLENNKDKYITQGNSQKRSVSIIVDENKEVVNFLEKDHIKYDYIVRDINEIGEYSYETINGAKDLDNFKSINSKIKQSKNICIKDYSDINSCIKYNYYIIKPKLALNVSNIIEIKNQILPGSLILISKNAKVEHVKVLLYEINYKDLSIVYVSDLIKEELD